MELKKWGTCYHVLEGAHTDTHPSKEQEMLRPLDPKAVTDLLCSLDISSFLICESGEDNGPILDGLLRPFDLLGPLI